MSNAFHVFGKTLSNLPTSAFWVLFGRYFGFCWYRCWLYVSFGSVVGVVYFGWLRIPCHVRHRFWYFCEFVGDSFRGCLGGAHRRGPCVGLNAKGGQQLISIRCRCLVWLYCRRRGFCSGRFCCLLDHLLGCGVWTWDSSVVVFATSVGGPPWGR